MAHYAQIDENGIVLGVVVVHNNDAPTEQDGIDFLHALLGADKAWVQCSYNAAIRGRYPAEGYRYDASADVFISPKPYPSWALDENHDWQPPTPKPDGSYWWDEANLQWVEE